MSPSIRAEKNQSPPSFLITSLPEDVVVDILARVPRRDYPRVSLVSKYFQSLVSSPEIYTRRSSLGCTEHCLYVILYNWANIVDRLYTLKNKGLVLIPGLLDMPPHDGSFVAVGSRIYVFCGMMTSSAFFIDCTSHNVQHLPRMPVPMFGIVADVIGGRIYVFGFLDTDQKSKAMVVFDTETQMWEDGMTNVMQIRNSCLVVIAGKMYAREFQKSFVYDPKESKWEMVEVLSLKFWNHKACVVDDVLYFYDWSGKELRAYDPEHKCWGMVKGLDDLLAKLRRGCWWARPVSYAGKLVLFFRRQGTTGEICYAKISLERRKGGQIWGKVDQLCDHGLIAGNFYLRKSLDVVL
ncbi:F-box/kelch-repeat protein [Raphanus sativus]|uniref:F-box/kelch-repeat protein At4g38940-like n=1 Tax=Raphanus sativus TaxID=3726 RepID=A0A6J0KRY2_RAPSA|nr:F-box/kelch-repeat protein At4g38940-like [Raphanus sativus]KAJ4879792.1 F-box/kelch-repeat protein [Raphanus sativus]